MAQVPNPGFEDWDSLSFVNNQKIYDPGSWFSSNSEMVSIGKSQPVTMSTDAHTGSYALKITSIIDDGQKQAGIIGSIPFALTGRVSHFDAWYKYAPLNADSFRVFLVLYKNGQFYGQAFVVSPEAKNEYTRLHWELSYPDNVPAPDSASFVIYASTSDSSEGSELLIDDISVGYKTTTGLDDLKLTAPISVYPNPADQRITFLGCPPKKILFLLHNTKGAVVKQGALEGNSLYTNDLGQGIYFIRLSDENGWSQQLKFMKQ